MPAQIFGTDAVVTILNRAFNDQSPSNATFNNQKAAAGTTEESQMAFAKTFGAGYAGQTADALSTLILGNLGVLPNAALQTAVKDYLTSVGVANVGIVALQLGQILSGLENATGDQAGFKAAAVAWNNEVTAAYNYSANTANTTPSQPGNNNTGGSFTLTVGNDSADVVGSAVNGGTYSTAGFKFTGSNDVVTSTHLNLGAGDSLTDGSSTDADSLNLALGGNTAGAATVAGIETVNITATNTAAAAADFTNFTGVKSYVVTGAPTAGVTLTGIDVAGVTSVDASGVTSATGGVTASLATRTTATTLKGGAGNDVLTAGNGGSVLTGGAGNDTLTGGTGADVITGGAGADTITLGAGGIDTVIIGNTDSRAISSATIDSITGFQGGIDKLQFSVAASATNYSELADSDLGSLNDAAAYTAAANLATVALTASGSAQYVFVGNSNTTKSGYLFLDHNGDGTLDVAVNLIGVNSADIARTDISIAA